MQVGLRHAGLLKGILAGLVLLALSLFGCAAVVGLHLHVLPDGRVVAHSHPTESNEKRSGQHTHSGQEYTRIGEYGKLLIADLARTAPPEAGALPPIAWVLTSDSAAALQLVYESPHKRSPPAHELC